MAKILFICHSRDRHGAEVVLQRSIEVAKASGHQCIVLMPSIIPDKGVYQTLANIVGEENIREAAYRAYGYGWLRTQLVKLYNLPTLMQIIRWIREEKIDTIYSNTSITCIGILAARLTHIRHIWHLHEPVDARFGWNQGNKHWYHRLMSSVNNHCIFISHQQKEQWEHTLGGEINGTIVYNPIRINESGKLPKKISDQELTIGYLGAFDTRKNIATLVEVFRTLRKTHPTTRLILCGAKDEAEQQQYTEEGIEVRLHTPNPQSFYHDIDILVLPSWAETMPLVILEAILNGVATVQTTESGMKELLKDEQDTYFVAPDDKQKLLHRIEQLHDTNKRLEIIQNGYTKISQYAFNQRYERQIADILCP